MSNEIDDINKRLAETLDKNRHDTEAIFNLGAELGRLLEKNGIQEYRSQVFIEIENKESIYKDICKEVDKIEEELLFLIKSAVKESIMEKRTFTFDSKHQQEKFSDKISDKWYIQLVSVEQEYVGGDFEVGFNVIGELADILDRYNVPKRITVIVENSTGDGKETLYNPSDVDTMYEPRLLIRVKSEDAELLKLKELVGEIERFTLFDTLKADY